MNSKLRIVFMGTPEFAVESLRVIIEAGYEVAAVITAPDKPSGRGRQFHPSPVKQYAVSQGIPVMQPVSLKDPGFISQLRSIHANLQVVVAFRMLPEIVWQMPELGTLNLHASLLPQYRGAAPINHAIINGETVTGLTTFFIEKEIDTGNIILSSEVPILSSDDAGTLHDRLMLAGGPLMIQTLKLIETGNVKAKKQDTIIKSNQIIHPAPKIFKNDCRINWDNPCEKIHNFIRGLSPYPGAFSLLITENDIPRQIKIFKTNCQQGKITDQTGTVITDHKKTLSVIASDGIIQIEELQIEGKKRMNISEFLRGVHFSGKITFQ